MVYGNGLLGKAFKKYENNPDICVHAAGVSNSSCQEQSEFFKDYNLLIETLQKHSNQKFLYFSSCSILDENLVESMYVQHKLKMEDLIKQHHKNYLIVRLPIVAGNTSNPNTLLNYLYNNIKTNNKFNIWKEAKRNIIDVEDIVNIVDNLLTNNTFNNCIINVANTHSYYIMDIVQAFEKLLNKIAIFDIINKKSSYDIDVSKTKHIVNFENTYLYKTIEKYYG
jgi:nucleoside-diphosphate-sugar epimerase